jgi:DNA-binding MarR family transcriptional regulator
MRKRKTSDRLAERGTTEAAVSDDARDFGACASCTCFAMRRAARAVTQHYDRLLRPTGLRVTQFTLLAALTVAGPLPINRLARRLGLERTTLTRNLRPLEAKGWVAVAEDADRRVHTVAITARGRAMARTALPAWREAQATVGARLADMRLGVLLAGG